MRGSAQFKQQGKGIDGVRTGSCLCRHSPSRVRMLLPLHTTTSNGFYPCTTSENSNSDAEHFALVRKQHQFRSNPLKGQWLNLGQAAEPGFAQRSPPGVTNFLINADLIPKCGSISLFITHGDEWCHTYQPHNQKRPAPAPPKLHVVCLCSRSGVSG